MSFIIDERDAPLRPMQLGRGHSVLLVNESTGSRYVDLHINVVRPGTGAGPYHYHSAHENIYFILEGRARILIEGRAVEAGPGVCVWIPPGEKHDVTNIGDSDLRLIEIKAPLGSDFIVVPTPEEKAEARR